MARVRSQIRASAFIRRAQAVGAFAAVVRRGDPDAGTLWIVVRQGMSLVRYTEQMALSGAREWYQDGPFEEIEFQLKANKAVDRDPDLWIIEIEDREGRAFLDGPLMANPQVSDFTDAELAAKALFPDR